MVFRKQIKKHISCDGCKGEMKRVLQRYTRRASGNASTHKYEKTQKGFLVRKYRNMQSRIMGIQKLKSHLYMGKSLLSRGEFYEWSIGNVAFIKLFLSWKQSKYIRTLCPTVDRIDPQKGYEIENMRWITHSENSRLGAINRNKQVKI